MGEGNNEVVQELGIVYLASIRAGDLADTLRAFADALDEGRFDTILDVAIQNERPLNTVTGLYEDDWAISVYYMVEHERLDMD